MLSGLPEMEAPDSNLISLLSVWVDAPSGNTAAQLPGAAVTVKVAAAVPLLPRDEVRAPLVFAAAPTVVDVTLTCTVQVVPAATVPPE